MLSMDTHSGMARLVFKIPTRGLLGYRAEFMTDTKGMGTLNYVFAEYGPYAGDFRTRTNGVMVTKDPCTSVAFALFHLQERGVMFITPQVKLYRGQIVGEHSRENDLTVNPGKDKRLTNMRTTASDEHIILIPAPRNDARRLYRLYQRGRTGGNHAAGGPASQTVVLRPRAFALSRPEVINYF